MRASFRFLALGLALFTGVAAADPVTYEIEADHTYPSFEADHMGLSIWRGKFRKSSGVIVMDRAASSGTVDITVDAASVDFGHDAMNEVARNDLFEVEKFPVAIYKGELKDFVDGQPTRVAGQLTMHGKTLPLDLKIVRYKCRLHPFKLREVCGADALGTLRRDDYGIDTGKLFGFDMEVTLRIAVEAVKSKPRKVEPAPVTPETQPAPATEPAAEVSAEPKTEATPVAPAETPVEPPPAPAPTEARSQRQRTIARF